MKSTNTGVIFRRQFNTYVLIRRIIQRVEDLTCLMYRFLSFSPCGWPLLLRPETSSLSDFAQTWLCSQLKQWPNHFRLLFSRNVSTGFMCASFLMSSFLMWSNLVFPIARLNVRMFNGSNTAKCVGFDSPLSSDCWELWRQKSCLYWLILCSNKVEASKTVSCL